MPRGKWKDRKRGITTQQHRNRRIKGEMGIKRNGSKRTAIQVNTRKEGTGRQKGKGARMPTGEGLRVSRPLGFQWRRLIRPRSGMDQISWAIHTFLGGGKARTRGAQGGEVIINGASDDMELDRGIRFHEGGYVNHMRSASAGGRGLNPRGRGSARGSGRFSSAGGRGAASAGSYLSSNQFYSLMENGEFDVDGCGEDQSFGAEVDLAPEGNARMLQDGDKGKEGQVIIFQGGSSSPSGMNLSF